ncbi:MAG: hypothetical protein U5R48_11550 [Gammaproteobacteria bacterium]|nr:hypothetical protein [Gammaproteobacteria bacterium]
MHLADRVATVFLSVVLVAAAITGGVWLQIDPDRALARGPGDAHRHLSLRPVAGDPDARRPPAATRLRRHGVLLGDPDALESVADCTEVCLDKTGTVTRPDDRSLQLVETAPGIDPQQARDRVAALEADIDHPLARAARAELGARAPARHRRPQPGGDRRRGPDRWRALPLRSTRRLRRGR